MRTLVTLLLLAAASAVQAAAPELPLRQPIRPWVVDFGETACSAVRVYGTPQALVTLGFRPSPDGTVVRLIVGRAPGARPGGSNLTFHFKASLSTGGAPKQTSGLHFRGKDETDIVWFNLSPGVLDEVRRSGEISVRGSAVLLAERFAVPKAAAVFDKLEECGTILRRYWNTGAGNGVVAKPAVPAGDPQRWVSDDDYPSQALFEGGTGRAGIVLLIDETGKVRDCMVQETSGLASLDAQSCLLLIGRARFKPALDAEGRPVRSTWRTHFTWKLGG